MKRIAALIGLILGAMLGRVIWGEIFRDNGARPGDPSYWRELEQVDSV